jgi:curved DNA-binding protein CbpA
LNYYQLLKISVVATEEEIRDAFHREALVLHPDRYQPSRDPEAIQMAKNIYSKLVDAYRTLSNRKKREEYDQNLQASNILIGANIKPSVSQSTLEKIKGAPAPSNFPPAGNLTPTPAARLTPEDENAITAVRKKPAGPATTAGIKFYKMAQTAFHSRDLATAKMNIQIALNTDPKNPEFLQFAERLESELGRKR